MNNFCKPKAQTSVSEYYNNVYQFPRFFSTFVSQSYHLNYFSYDGNLESYISLLSQIGKMSVSRLSRPCRPVYVIIVFIKSSSYPSLHIQTHHPCIVLSTSEGIIHFPWDLRKQSQVQQTIFCLMQLHST